LSSLIRAKCLHIPLYATEACPLLSRNRSSFEFTVTSLFVKLSRTTSPAVVKCCQLAFCTLPVHSQLDNWQTANFLQKFIAYENSLCYLFTLTARRKINELFAQFDNVRTHVSFIILNLIVSLVYMCYILIAVSSLSTAAEKVLDTNDGTVLSYGKYSRLADVYCLFYPCGQ